MDEVTPAPTRRWIVPMAPRQAHEPSRTATTLELFFDLVFVVAVAQASASLHHEIAADHAADGILSFVLMFFGIWWAWMNFTWFASAYDTDDVPYRLLAFLQMSGALIFAAGITQVFDERNFAVAVAGYVVMRVAMAAQWLRAARSDPARATCCRRYAAGIAACQVGWIGLLLLPHDLQVPVFFVLGACELLVPVWAERAEPTTWHPGHIVERYGLFTIIVLGELVLSAFFAAQGSLDGGAEVLPLVKAGVGAALLAFSMWWLYFSQPAEEVVAHAREAFDSRTGAKAFIWGYGHVLVLGSIAAVGAGIAVVVDQQTHHAEISHRTAVLAVALPLALYLVSVWGVHHDAARSTARTAGYLGSALAVLVLGALGAPLWSLGLVTTTLVALTVVLAEREPSTSSG